MVCITGCGKQPALRDLQPSLLGTAADMQPEYRRGRVSGYGEDPVTRTRHSTWSTTRTQPQYIESKARIQQELDDLKHNRARLLLIKCKIS